MDITEMQDRQQDALKSNSVQTETTQEQEKLEPVLTQYFRTGARCIWKLSKRLKKQKQAFKIKKREGGEGEVKRHCLKSVF